MLTIRDLSERLDEPEHRIDYAVRRHGPKHAGRIAMIRVWHESDLPAIRESMRRTGLNNRSHRSLERADA